MIIYVDELIEDIAPDCYGAYFGGALIEVFDIDNASPEELVRMAHRKEIDLSRYEPGETKRCELCR